MAARAERPPRAFGARPRHLRRDFPAEALSEVRDVCFLTYRLRSNTATVERSPGEPWLRITIPA